MAEPKSEPTGRDAAGASFHGVTDWHAIDWQNVNHNVRRLQARIVKATEEKRWGKVKALQRLLTHSFSGKALAVRRVTENQGKNTPGVDRVTWNTPQKKINAVYSLRQRDYHPQPMRRVYIPKKNGKKRPLGIPVMKCRAMQALYLLALDPVAETTADPNSYGFRPGRSTADAIEQCFCTLAKQNSPQWVLEGDIKGCFDAISHEWLLAHIPVDRTMLKKWLKAGYMDRHVFHPSEEGTPQGGIISPVLANMTLDGLENLLQKAFPRSVMREGKCRRALVHFIRYADDFIITGRSKEILEQEVKPLVEQFMRERGLQLSPEKTVITHIEEGFDFLGQNVRKYKAGKQYKLLIKPSKKNVKAFLEKVRETVKANKALSAGKLIEKLNPIIRGWANYHRHIVSKETFNTVDEEIYHAVRRWIRRKHPRKSDKWIAKKYFTTVGSNNWVFYGTIDDEYTAHLLEAVKVPITRHRKVQGEANPYDPEWERYFEKRLDAHMMATLKGKEWLHHLWKEQNGECPVCRQKITKSTGWHSHHILWRSKGGPDTQENRVLLHPTCHQQVHSQGISVTKPRPTDKKGRTERLEPDE
ncbi:MAG: group II intron reverse transcriptase/maturase [Ktedonobacteraceae bacterium]